MQPTLIHPGQIAGFRIGHAQDAAAGTGCTVILCEQGAVTGCDVRGGGPASRETELLKPVSTVDAIHAVMLSGGSAFGLDAGAGAMRYLAEKGIGVAVPPWKVPLVCGASLFDFPVTDGKTFPDQAMGYAACQNAAAAAPAQGNVGAGTGATVGKLCGLDRTMKCGFGWYGMQLGEVQVAALVAVNALGNVCDPDTGAPVAGLLTPDKRGILSTVEAVYESTQTTVFRGNTTLGCVLTNAALTKAQMNKVAAMTHNGYARAIRPVHTTGDGDTVFAMSTAAVPAGVDLVGVMAADCMARAILSAARHAQTSHGFLAACDLPG